MTMLETLVRPEWSCSRVLVDTYVHSSPDMSDDYRDNFGKFFDNLSDKCCIRLAHIAERELPLFTYRLMPKEDGFSVLWFKNITQYSAGTYLIVSAQIEEDGSSGIDSAIDVITGHVGLVRVLRGPRTAWSLVQRSIVDVSNGDMQDPSPVIPVPNIHNKIWDDDIDKEELIRILHETPNSDRLWRSLRLAGRGSDALEPDKALWFWSAIEVLCGCENEAGITKSLAKVYGCSEEVKTFNEKFGIRHAARARHDVAHKGAVQSHGSEITEYYVALYVDLLSGLYLNRCVGRAKKMIDHGFDPNILYQQKGSRIVLDIDVGDGDWHS